MKLSITLSFVPIVVLLVIYGLNLGCNKASVVNLIALYIGLEWFWRLKSVQPILVNLFKIMLLGISMLFIYFIYIAPCPRAGLATSALVVYLSCYVIRLVNYE